MFCKQGEGVDADIGGCYEGVWRKKDIWFHAKKLSTELRFHMKFP